MSSALPWPPAPVAARFHARAFPAQAGDLDIAFSGVSRPALVTALLCACLQKAGQPLMPELAWHWTAAERLQGMLAIAASSLGPTLAAIATCTVADCGERFELELGVAGFAATAPDSLTWQSPEGANVRIALPTGELQQAWHEAEQDDERWLARQLVLEVDAAAAAPDWLLPVNWLEPLAQALEAADPLTALSLPITCPCCGQALDVDVDIEQLVLDGLRRRQQAWLDDVHRLALAYHWHEAQIVALPDWRRQQYLQRVLAESP